MQNKYPPSADAKGIVMYAQATEEEQAAAMKFLEFVYSDENNDMKLLEMTSGLFQRVMMQQKTMLSKPTLKKIQR